MTRDPQRPYAAIGISLVFALAFTVKAGWLAGVDLQLAQWLVSSRTASIEAAARAITFFGSTPCAITIAVGLMSWWLLKNQRRTVVVFLAAWLCGIVLQTALRILVAQVRPGIDVPATAGLWDRIDLAGFTSGHAFRAAFLGGWCSLIFWQLRAGWARVAAAGIWALVVLVGITRVMLGRHWPTDVVGGWLIALTMLAAAQHWKMREGTE